MINKFQADIYSLALVLYHIFSRSMPWSDEEKTCQRFVFVKTTFDNVDFSEILDAIINYNQAKSGDPPPRPSLDTLKIFKKSTVCKMH